MGRRAAKVDGNHGHIVDALRAAGCSVQSLAEVGQGCPDLLCAVAGQLFLIEVKDPQQDPCKRRLTPMQKAWHQGWRAPVHLVETLEQAMLIVASYRPRHAAGGARFKSELCT